MAVRKVLLAALVASALVIGFYWMKRPSNLNLAPMYVPIAVGLAFAAFLLVIVGACFVFLWLKQVKAARDICLLGGCGAILVLIGMVVLPEPTQVIHNPANVSLGIGMGLNTPLGFIALALVAGGMLLHFARRKNIVK